MQNLNSDASPFGNVHFAYDVTQNKFLFLDKTLIEIVEGHVEPHQILHCINVNDFPIAERAFLDVLASNFEGCIKIRIGKGGVDQWIQVTPFYNLEMTIIYGSVVNVSAEVENFDSISKYANKKNSILHMLAHDLRGPLAIAKSLVAQMASYDDEGLKKKSAALSTILKQSIDLITNLTDREFIEMTGNVLVKTHIDLVQKLGEYLEECRQSSEVNGRTFLLESAVETAMAEIDEAKFMQVVNNLVSNALKFTTADGIIRVGIEPHRDFIMLTFSDNGIGVPESLIPHVFDKFTIASRNGLNGEPTIGLGLSIVKKIIDWHEGEIWCESTQGKGTSFFIKLPLLSDEFSSKID